MEKEVNGGSEELRKKLLPGPRFRTEAPSIIAAVKSAMERFPRNIDAASKDIKMNQGNYAFIRKLLIIQQDPTLPRDDIEALESIMARIEEERRTAEVRESGEALIEKYWRKRKERPTIVNRRRRRFDQTILSIRESCATIDDMPLPKELNREDVTDAITALTASIERVSKLVRKLVGGIEEER
jgi:hypothetical protein